MRSQAKQLLRRAHLEQPARAVYSAYEERKPHRRRDRADNEHLRMLLAFTLGPSSNCLDIGCNHGIVLEQIVRHAPQGRHIAFEPVPSLASALAARFPSVDVRQVALSDEAGTATFSHVVDADGYSGLSDRDLAGHEIEHLEVPLARLDDELPDGYVPDFMKIDVEGAEYQLLQGAERLLSEHRPPIWFEHGEDGSSHFGATSADVWDLLTGHGYRIFDADGHGPLGRAEFSACLGRMWNFLAH